MTRMEPIADPRRAEQVDPEQEHPEQGTGRPSLIARLRAISPLFTALVIVPTLLATLYFGFLASDVYVSESRFVVRSLTKPNLSPLGAVLGGGNIVGASEESSAVMEFLGSRQALSEINQDGYVSKAWNNSSIFLFDRFGWSGGDTSEQLFEYYLGKVAPEKSAATSVTVLQVESFDAASAQAINLRLLEKSELLVNELSDRARSDAITFAEAELDRARTAAQGASVALATFRDQEGVIDPELQATAGLQFISKLQDQLIAARTQLLQMQTYTPQASQIPFLRTQISTLEREIATQTAQLAGGRQSLSSASARYQELLLASEFAEKQLSIALASYQDAQAEARRKQAYVERISQPSLPDYAQYPRRIRNIFATLVLGLLAWGVVSMLLVGVREHRD